MVEMPVKPFRLKYSGRDADKHTIDALYLGQSLQGTARVYNSVIDYHFHGKIRNHTLHHIRINVGPPKRGSLMYMIYLMLMHGKMPLYPELFFELAGLLIPASIKAIIGRRTGQTKMLEKAVDQMHETYSKHQDFMREVHQDHVQDKKRLFDVVDKLVDMNSQPLKHMAAPIGRSVEKIEHFPNTAAKVVVDEPIAEALRTEQGEVGEMETYVGKIIGVDKPTATCKMLLEGMEKPVRCRITDPALLTPKNVYTHALDVDSVVRVTAKPVTKQGEISTLYVMDAKPAKGRRSVKRASKKKAQG